MKRIKKIIGCCSLILLMQQALQAQVPTLPALQVSANKRFFCTADGKPFFWLGDTGWLLFIKTKREEAIQYLDDRQRKRFNVIQVMLVHDIKMGVNAYGDSSIRNNDISQPVTTAGTSFSNDEAYDFWDHVDFIIDEAAKRGIYMALVPLWGGNVKHVNDAQAKIYAGFLANRYKGKSNIIWLNGGDIKGSDGFSVWETIGKTIRSIDKKHLIGFHPRGRNSSSTWFHKEEWLDFNMFQSGHRSYAQDTSANETLHYGEDNWRYVNDDYKLKPEKPTFDGEPSYEGIPYGLHDSTQPYWTAPEIRRYAWWSVFAGGCGFTYGNNSVMQFYTPGDAGTSFFPKEKWQDGLKMPGSGQMQYLGKLLLSETYFDRVPDQSLVLNNGEKYEKIISTRGKDFALFYIYTGRDFKVNIDKLHWGLMDAYWFDPRTGEKQYIFKMRSDVNRGFYPPGGKKEGNDWVLVIEKSKVKIKELK